MFVCCECCVLSGRGLCDELITRPEESYRVWCVVVCNLETSRMRKPWPALGRSATEKKKYYYELWPRDTTQYDNSMGKTKYKQTIVKRIIAVVNIPRARGMRVTHVIRSSWSHKRSRHHASPCIIMNVQ